MGAEVVTVRLDEKTRKQISEFSQSKLESQSDIIRKAILQYVQKETELDEIKKFVAKKFAEGKISFDELVRIIGFDEAKKVAFFVDTAEKSFQEGI
ncbi:MAG: DUF6290 family protein [Candidatus Diapherotrites archaeon]